jgi:DUF1009 family protein
MTQQTVGLLAGAGDFPISFARKAREMGLSVVTVALSGEACRELRDHSAHFYWSGLARLGRMINCFRRHGCHEIVMAGKVRKHNYMHRPWKLFTLWPDMRTIRWWYSRSRSDNKDDTLLLSVIREFEKEGLRVGSALETCPELLAREGCLTRLAPDAAALRDILFGWGLAREMGRLDVGQSVAVKDMAVLAVEAIEGTDAAILRAGSLCKSGKFTLVKVAKPNQDMRFDVPTVGVTTIRNLHQAGGRYLAIEAGKTILLNEAETLATAEKLGICVVALKDPGTGMQPVLLAS